MLTLIEKEILYDALVAGERLHLRIGSMVALRGKPVCTHADLKALMPEVRGLREIAGGVWAVRPELLPPLSAVRRRAF
jgi:hypothetical protein